MLINWEEDTLAKISTLLLFALIIYLFSFHYFLPKIIAEVLSWF